MHSLLLFLLISSLLNYDISELCAFENWKKWKPKSGRKPCSSSSSKISNVEISRVSTCDGNIVCSIKRSTTGSKMLLLDRKCCQWSILRGPSATCADVCGNETTCRSGLCVLLHQSKGVAGFTLFLTTGVKRVAPPIVSTPTFPLHLPSAPRIT